MMTGICVCAVTGKLLFDDDIKRREITLEDGRQGRILYLMKGEAAIEIQHADGSPN